MGDPKEYEVLRDHGAKPGGAVGAAFKRGETRELRPEEALPLVRAGVLKAQGDEPEADEGEKMEKRPLNKAEPISEVKRGPGRPRKTPDDDDDED